MTRADAVTWLNHRLHIFKTMGRHNHYDINDVTFFMSFIHDRTGESVALDQVVSSIRNYPQSCKNWVEKLINYLVFTYKVDTVVEQTQKGMEAFTDFLGVSRDSFKILKYE